MDFNKLMRDSGKKNISAVEQSFIVAHVSDLAIVNRLDALLVLCQAKSSALRDWAGCRMGYEYLCNNDIHMMDSHTNRIHHDYLVFTSSAIHQLPLNDRVEFIVRAICRTRDSNKRPESLFPSQEWAEMEFDLLPQGIRKNALVTLLVDSDARVVQWAIDRLSALGESPIEAL